MLKRVDHPGPNDDRPIGELIGQLYDDGRAYARSEMELWKAKGLAEASRYRSAAIFAAAGVALGLAALVAFAMTLVIGFARVLGPFGGGAAAVVILALGAYVMFNFARQRLEDIRPVKDDGDE